MNRPHQFTAWRRSTRSEYDSNCLEVALAADDTAIGVRDSKHLGPVLSFNLEDWQALLARLRNGELDI